MPRPTFSRDDAIDADFVAGIEDAQDKVTRFIDKLIEAEVDGDVTIELKPLGIGEASVIQAWNFSPKTEDPAGMADSIVDRAAEEGDVFGGERKFEVTVEGHKGRCHFALKFRDREDDDIDELPNGKGLVAQQMRHNEKLVKMIIGVVGETQKTARQQLHEANERIKNLERVQIDSLKSYAEILDTRQIRDLEMTKLMKGEERKDQIGSMVMQSIPAIVNRVTGNKTLGGPTPLETMFEAFLRTIDPNQLNAFLSEGTLKLRPEQLRGFMEIFKAIHDRATAGQPSAQDTNTSSTQAAE